MELDVSRGPGPGGVSGTRAGRGRAPHPEPERLRGALPCCMAGRGAAGVNARQRLGRRAGGAATDTWGPVPALRPQLGQGHGQFHALRAEPAPRHSAHQRSPGATAVLPSPPPPHRLLRPSICACKRARPAPSPGSCASTCTSLCPRDNTPTSEPPGPVPVAACGTRSSQGKVSCGEAKRHSSPGDGGRRPQETAAIW